MIWCTTFRPGRDRVRDRHLLVEHGGRVGAVDPADQVLQFAQQPVRLGQQLPRIFRRRLALLIVGIRLRPGPQLLEPPGRVAPDGERLG